MSIKDWIIGAPIWGELVGVRGLQRCPPGRKLPQVEVIVFDATGFRTATSWQLPVAQVEQIASAVQQNPPLLRVSGTVDDSEKYAGQLKLIGVVPVSPEEAESAKAEDFLEAFPQNHAEAVAELDRLIRRVKDPYLASLLQKTIGFRGSLRALFVQASAAKRNHHAYPGGLLQHSLEVTDFALHAAQRFRKMHSDLVIAAGLLHDVGKLWEMEHGWQRGEYTDAGDLLGHVYIGTERVSAVCRHLKFPKPLHDLLLHAILAHHDEEQLGSPVRPKTAEAIAIAKSDQMSAEISAFFQVQQEAPPFQRRVVHAGRFLFLGNGLPDASTTVNPPTYFPQDDPEDRLLSRLSGRKSASQTFGIASLPILGMVAAGDGVESAATETEPETRETCLPADGADFLLHVTGDSMKDGGILAGDVLVVRAGETAKVGQIVVAYVPGKGPVVKRLAQTEKGRFLASDNPVYEPIPVSEEVRIQGTVVRVERDLP